MINSKEEKGDVSSKRQSEDGLFITYNLQGDLPNSSTGGLLVDKDTWMPIGIHLMTNHAIYQGKGILFNGLIKWLRASKPEGLEKFGEVFDLNKREKPTARPTSDEPREFRIPESVVKVIARSVSGMIFTRSAIYLTPGNKFVVYDGLTK